MNSVCVYCGSSFGNSPGFREAAVQLGQELAHRKLTLIYGGASIGIMGVIANAVLENGGKVIGVIPKVLAKKEVAHHGLTELKIVHSMHDRKAQMAELSDAFIALPGGLGTLEELFEILTWAQLGLHQKPCALLNVEHYYDNLIRFLDHSVEQQFVKLAHRAMLMIDDNPQTLIDKLLTYQAPLVERWLSQSTI